MLAPPPHTLPITPVLRVIDQTVLIALPVIAIAVLAVRSPTTTWWVPSMALLGLAVAIAAIGQLGRAPWRRSAYPLVAIAAATTSLASTGPLLGVGATCGLAAVLAGSLLSRAATAAIVAFGIAGIATHGVIFGRSPPDPLTFDSLALWLRVAVVTGLLLWMATRVLVAITSSLEQAYLVATEAYQLDANSRAQVERKRQDLEDAEQVEMVGRLAGGVAHDVNNALTAILAASDVLGDKLSTTRSRRYLAELESASRHAAELVRDLLWIGRKLPPSTEDARLRTVVEASRGRLERMGRALELELDVDPELLAAISPERLEQIVFWLLLRARRAGVTQIAVVGRRVDDQVALDLHGLTTGSLSTSLDLRPRAVQAQMNSAAAQEIVAQAGGTLSMSDDRGMLAVQLRLPVAVEVATARPSPLSIPRPRTALVVDDDPRVLARLAKLVERRGYRVCTATSLAEAWPLLDADPDLLVTDLQLGDGRGDELAIASFARAPKRPIVVCSGFGADDALSAALEGARVRYLTKPFTMRELEATIPHTGDDEAA